MSALPGAARARRELAAIEAGSILAAHRAAERLRRGVVPPLPLAALRRAHARGDGLARLLLLQPLAAAGDPRPALEALRRGAAAERAHAALALGALPPAPDAASALHDAARRSGVPGLLARLALEARAGGGPRPGPAQSASTPPRPEGLRVAQVVLRGRLDAGLRHVGAGDGGGVATLAVGLARALGRRAEVDRSFVLARPLEGADGGPEPLGARAELVRVGVAGEGADALADASAAVEGELEAALRSLAPLDAVHLRFADVGTLLAARAAIRARTPIVFTLAPDPHRPIEAREAAGTLGRADFPAAEEREGLLLRLRLVEWLARRADGLVLLPGGEPGELERLLGGPLGRPATVVPEGIVEAAAGPPTLDLPPGRGLPLLVSVGRLDPVKGMPRLVEAWAGDPLLARSFDLVLAGGDLERPSPAEARELAAVERVLERHPAARPGLRLLGSLPHGEVAELLRLAREGIPGRAARGGVYACASLKEEFGVALLEALGAGLPVVAPAAGGPPTYVADGVHGALVAPGSVEALREGIRRAAALRLDEARAAAAQRLVRERYSIDRVAASLVDVYAGRRADRLAA